VSDASDRGVRGVRRRVARWLRERRHAHPCVEPRKVFVYTAITGSYDEPPTFRDLDESIACFCFTDALRELPEPWQLQPIPSYFGDPKLTSGFLKTHPHLLFPADSTVVWVDGNLDELSLSVAGVDQLLGDRSVAVPAHRERDRVRDEAEVVARLQLDDPVRVQRLLQSLQTAGFPDDLGLSATMFLVRDLSDPAMPRMNETWWRAIAELSRRDQLTFEFALWRSGLRKRVIEADYREPNELFVRKPHAAPQLRVLDQDVGSARAQTTAWLSVATDPPGHGTPVWYQERWTSAAAALLRRLNGARGQSCASRTGEGYGHGQVAVGERTPPDIRRSWQREFLRRSAATSRRALLIGCDGGYAAAVLLESNPVIEVRVTDEEHHRRPCAGMVELGRTHPGRAAVSSGWAPATGWSALLDGVDLVHIDATATSHSTADLCELLAELDGGALVVIRGTPGPLNGVEKALPMGHLEAVTPGFPSEGLVRLYRWAPDEERQPGANGGATETG
jgi:hypothetical protein